MRYDTGECTVQLATSRDGIHVKRRFHRSCVPPNPNAKRVGKQLAYTAYMGPGMMRVGDELWMYGLETDVPHDSVWYGKRTPGGVHRYGQRLDGFISLDAGGKPGTVVTKPFFLRGKHVEINVDASLAESSSTGSLMSVAVLGTDGKIVAQSQPIRSDGVAQRLLWKDRKDLADWVGKPVRLRFTLRYAKLFAFQVVGKLPSSGPR